MHPNSIHFEAVAALVVLASAFSTAAFAAEEHVAKSMQHKSTMTKHTSTYSMNSNSKVQHRNFSQNNDDHDSGNRHRRHRGIGFGGISIDLGSIDSGCRYSYRKWQATGSRYWRQRYNDCIG
jgi:hypothetical protein